MSIDFVADLVAQTRSRVETYYARLPMDPTEVARTRASLFNDNNRDIYWYYPMLFLPKSFVNDPNVAEINCIARLAFESLVIEDHVRDTELSVIQAEFLSELGHHIQSEYLSRLNPYLQACPGLARQLTECIATQRSPCTPHETPIDTYLQECASKSAASEFIVDLLSTRYFEKEDAIQLKSILRRHHTLMQVHDDLSDFNEDFEQKQSHSIMTELKVGRTRSEAKGLFFSFIYRFGLPRLKQLMDENIWAVKRFPQLLLLKDAVAVQKRRLDQLDTTLTQFYEQKKTLDSVRDLNSIPRAVHFLECAQTDGHWMDFHTTAGESNVWVTAYVTALLQNSFETSAIVSAGKAFLSASRTPQGWGYHPDVPADADSTAWCLIALSDSLAPETAKTLLSPFECKGGYSTYSDAESIARYIGYAPDDVSGWRSAHPCVTAICALAQWSTETTHTDAHLIAVLERNIGKSARPYWYGETYYALHWSLHALQKLGRAPSADWIHVYNQTSKSLMDGLLQDVNGRTCVFSTCLALRTARILESMLNISPKAYPVVDEILTLQLPDGSWVGSTPLLVPHPNEKMPQQIAHWPVRGRGVGTLRYDHRRIFTTATVLYTLSSEG
ncbi:MAG: hypothetical protein U0Z75_07270 [Deinococcaceae bacterium]